MDFGEVDPQPHRFKSWKEYIDFSKVFNSIDRWKMEQILQAYGLAKETVTFIMMIYKNIKAMVH